MIRSIPPSRRLNSSACRINAYRVNKRVPYYACTRSSTLESLLAEAERLESEQIEVVKLLPYDEELQKLDKLQRVISQLKRQIILVRKKKAAEPPQREN